MLEKKQKNLFETFLELQFKYFVLIRPSDDQDYVNEMLSEHKDILDSTNIYFICKKPRLKFIETSIIYDDKNLQIGFELMTKNSIKKECGTLQNYPFFFPNANKFSLHERKSKLVVTRSNNTSITIPIEEIFMLFDATNSFKSFLDNEVLDYHILYIGQGLGKTNESNAYKRIMRHQKLQLILSQIIENEPYNEVFVLLFTLDNPYFSGICDYKFYNNQSKNNFESIINFSSTDRFSKKELVNIMEACLIKYFCPPFNIHLTKFPKGNEKLIQKCQKYDINSIFIRIDTSEKNLYLSSQTTCSKCAHDVKIPLHKDNSRVTFQDILNKENTLI